MAERFETAHTFIRNGHSKILVLHLCGVPKSSYYFKPLDPGLCSRKGIAKSEVTATKSGMIVSNQVVVEDIKQLLAEEFVDYGYLKVTYFLRDEKSYVINHKKVYRLMKSAGLLNVSRVANKTGKQWVTDLVPNPAEAFVHWEFDIKFIYIAALGRYAPLLSVIDVYSRYLIGWILQWSIRKEDVKSFFDLLISDYTLPQKVFVRCDNGSQFESNLVREYFASGNITQEFTRPATPQQNAHIESYHSIIQSAVCNRFEFESFAGCHEVLIRWQTFYNDKRIHSGIEYKSPVKYLRSKNLEPPLRINKAKEIRSYIVASSKTEASSAGEQLARDSLTE